MNSVRFFYECWSLFDLRRKIHSIEIKISITSVYICVKYVDRQRVAVCNLLA